MAKVLRGMVSKKKRRFQENGFDLDLSYITDRIIAMGFPSENLEGIYRNPMSEVQKFLDTSHEGHYRVYNLCSERCYDHKKFNNQVMEFPFDDHNCPELDRITFFCEDVQQWLDADPANVAVIHCKAGKGRTGLMICCYLQYSRKCATASEALQFFAQRRTMNHKGVTLHSQRRYVHYFEKVLLEGPRDPVVLQLDRIRMHTIPNFSKLGSGSEPWFAISRAGRTIYYSDPVKGVKGAQVVDFECSNLLLSRDIKIEFFNKTLKGKMFYFWFHTSYIKNNYFCLRKRDLEKACKDKACKHYSPSFKIECFFTSIDAGENRDRSVTERQRADTAGVCGACNCEVRNEDQSLTLNGIIHHWDCLRCFKCGRGFSGNRNCIIQDGHATCERCDVAEFFSRCASCNRVLTDYSVVEAGDLAWHFDCFRCSHCKVLLDHKSEDSHMVVDGLPYCNEHCGQTPTMLQCASPTCEKAAIPATLAAIGADWHPECFRCVRCNILLDPQHDKIRNQDGLPLCEEACGEPVLCKRCTEPITPDDLSRLSGETYHTSRCFGCEQCGTQLSEDPAQVQIREGKLFCVAHELRTCASCARLVSDADEECHEGAHWHTSCFQCGICGENMSGGGVQFVIQDGVPTCLRHHLTCSHCGDTITSDASLVTLGGCDWHRECCVCQLDGCEEALAPETVLSVNGKFFCGTHPHCYTCHEPVGPAEVLENEVGHFHDRCFRCAECDNTLDALTCGYLDDDLLCQSCHPGPFCCMCQGILPEQHLIILDGRYHFDCYCCIVCEAPFESVDDPVAITDEGKPICMSCSTISCAACGESITGEVIEALDKSYHLSCFVCAQCSCPLTEQFGIKDDAFFCASCLVSANLPKCTGCGKAIQGKHTLAGGKPFHYQCFKCYNCQSSFSSSGSVQFLMNSVGFFCANCESAYLATLDGGAPASAANGQAGAAPEGGVDARQRSGTTTQADASDHATRASFRRSSRFASPSEALSARSSRLSIGSSGKRWAGGSDAPAVAERAAGAGAVEAASGAGASGGGGGGGEGSSQPPAGERADAGPQGGENGRTLQKEGFLKKKGAKRRNWKRRYFRLNGKLLRYYRSPKDTAALGEVTLSPLCQIMHSNERAHSIDLVTPERTYYLVAEDDASLQSWMDALHDALAL